MRELEVTIESGLLARSLSNALAFVSARCIFPWVRLELDESALALTGGDLWAFGREAVELTPPEGDSCPLACILTRSDAMELEKLARADKTGAKSETGHLRTVGPGPTGDWLVEYQPGKPELEQGSWIAYGAEDLTSKPTVKGEEDSAFSPGVYFAQVDRLLQRLQPEMWGEPLPLAFTPDILSRFAKVKRHDDEPTIMDCWAVAPDEPILVKIGPSFTGAIQPVVREVYQENNPEAEGLWAS